MIKDNSLLKNGPRHSRPYSVTLLNTQNGKQRQRLQRRLLKGGYVSLNILNNMAVGYIKQNLKTSKVVKNL